MKKGKVIKFEFYKNIIIILILLYTNTSHSNDTIKKYDFSRDITIVFGSCSDQELDMQHWSVINKLNPDLMILMGDNVYGDFIDSSANNLRDAYETLLQNKDFSNLLQKTMVLTIWDDHDFGRNDGGKNWIFKNQAKDLFLNYYNIPFNDIRRKRSGLEKSWLFYDNDKTLKVIVLDTRTYRDDLLFNEDFNKYKNYKYMPDFDNKKTILGQEQWSWLSKELEEEVDILLLVSSIQVIPKSHGWEKWQNFPHERKKLFDLLANSKTKSIYVLSGDRHFAAIYKKDINGKLLYEITSSSLNKSITGIEEYDIYREGKLIDKNNFGRINVDWNKRDISFDIISSKASDSLEILESLKLSF